MNSYYIDKWILSPYNLHKIINNVWDKSTTNYYVKKCEKQTFASQDKSHKYIEIPKLFVNLNYS